MLLNESFRHLLATGTKPILEGVTQFPAHSNTQSTHISGNCYIGVLFPAGLPAGIVYNERSTNVLKHSESNAFNRRSYHATSVQFCVCILVDFPPAGRFIQFKAQHKQCLVRQHTKQHSDIAAVPPIGECVFACELHPIPIGVTSATDGRRSEAITSLLMPVEISARARS